MGCCYAMLCRVVLDLIGKNDFNCVLCVCSGRLCLWGKGLSLARGAVAAGGVVLLGRERRAAAVSGDVRAVREGRGKDEKGKEKQGGRGEGKERREKKEKRREEEVEEREENAKEKTKRRASEGTVVNNCCARIFCTKRDNNFKKRHAVL